jgi:hypothetical protein
VETDWFVGRVGPFHEIASIFLKATINHSHLQKQERKKCLLLASSLQKDQKDELPKQPLKTM